MMLLLRSHVPKMSKVARLPHELSNRYFSLLNDYLLWAKNLGSANRHNKHYRSKKSIKDERRLEINEKPHDFVQQVLKQIDEIQKQKQSTQGPAGGPNNKKIPMYTTIGLALALYLVTIWLMEEKQKLGSWKKMHTDLLLTGQLKKIVISEEQEKAFLYTKTGMIYEVFMPNVSHFERQVRTLEQHIPPEQWVQIEKPPSTNMIIGAVVMTAVLFGLYILYKKSFSIQMGGLMSSFKSHIKLYDPHAKNGKLGIKFKDVAGLHEAKVEMKEFVEYLKKPGKFALLGAKLPKGALLTGPPGCGKTLLAKALAAESSVPFISINGSEFIEMIGGMGAARVRDLFKQAKSRAPCIIYIDEIDAVGRKRHETAFSSGEEEQTLNQLLVEMDGMESNQGIVVIGSTNRADILDRALLRPGRFDRHITIDFPTLTERKELFEMYLRRIKLDNALMNLTQRLSQMTPRFSGADIRNVVNEAAIHAATNQEKIVTLKDINYAMEKIIAGSKVLVQEEKEIVAYHESGHALVGWLLEHTDALLKVTIIPRTNAALGFAQYSPRDKKLFHKEELFDRMCMMLGGRAAESVIFNRITTGAQNDLEKVRKSAYAQVRDYGMSEVLGPLSFAASPGSEDAAEFAKKPYGQYLQSVIDEEVNKLVTNAYFFTESLLKSNRDKLETIAKALLKRETLSFEDVKKLIGPPKFRGKQIIDLEQILPDLDQWPTK